MQKPLYVSLLLLIIDRIIKDIVIGKIHLGESFLILEKWGGLGFHFLLNKNIAFSISFFNNVLMIVIPIIFIVLTYFFLQSSTKNSAWYFSYFFILFGGISNYIDRIIYNGVIDYIQIFVWPVFNIADVLIVLGGILFLMTMLNEENKNMPMDLKS